MVAWKKNKIIYCITKDSKSNNEEEKKTISHEQRVASEKEAPAQRSQ